MRIYITGESGVIPNAMTKLAPIYGMEVVNSQLQLTNVDQYKRFQAFKIRKPEIDFTDINVFRKAIDISKPDVIIHSGAFVGTDFVAANKGQAVDVNVMGTQNVVDVANEYGIKVIYFSTTAIFDPYDYGQDEPINKNTNINPQTLYGISKYAGELVVKNLCKTQHSIIRPVFGFGNYPDDLHSALTKLIYFAHQKDYNDHSQLTILLNTAIGKNYFRVENIAATVLNMLSQGKYFPYGINVGESYSLRKNWSELMNIVIKKSPLSENQLSERLGRIKFDASADYLQWHNIDNSQVAPYLVNLINLETGIDMTIKSVMANQDIKPYWI